MFLLSFKTMTQLTFHNKVDRDEALYWEDL